MKPAPKGRSKKRCYAIGKPRKEDEPEAAFLETPDDLLYEEVSF
jgi:hypothetical protein